MRNQTGRGQISGGRGLGPAGSTICICPKCGHEEEHKRGAPCSRLECPKCGVLMKGEICSS